MIDTDKYEKMTWETPSDELEDAVENLLVEVNRLREAFITAVRHLDVKSRNEMFNAMDADLQSIWLFRSE